MYKPRLVANALLHKARSEGVSLTHLKLQKLLFFMQAWGLALSNNQVFSELPEAWPYGPVYTSIYHELKDNGSESIRGYLEEPDLQTGKFRALVPNRGDTKFWNLLKQVWERYGSFTAGQLSTLSHVSGGPWDLARKKGEDRIDPSEIRQFYSKRLSNHAG